uniref:Transmembrane protein 222a n=1 Tax=Esox lucius TaxID=8010 RepID=A0A6Q2Y4E7_ESOLU
MFNSTPLSLVSRRSGTRPQYVPTQICSCTSVSKLVMAESDEINIMINYNGGFEKIDRKNSRYPYCIVWTPIPILTRITWPSENQQSTGSLMLIKCVEVVQRPGTKQFTRPQRSTNADRTTSAVITATPTWR